MEHIGYDRKGKPHFVHEKGDPLLSDELLGSSPTGRLWSTLWEWGEVDGDMSDFANSTEISRPSLYKIFPTFVEHGWIIPSRKVRGVQLYKADKKNKIVKMMFEMINRFVWQEVMRGIDDDAPKFVKRKKRKK